jgi:hypothetical protein
VNEGGKKKRDAGGKLTFKGGALHAPLCPAGHLLHEGEIVAAAWISPIAGIRAVARR